MAKVTHSDLCGTRTDKYARLSANPPRVGSWAGLNLNKPFHLFIAQDQDARVAYDRGYPVTDICPVNTVGVVTGQDDNTISFSLEETQLLATALGLPPGAVKPSRYWPLDTRYVVSDRHAVKRQHVDVMLHMLAGVNISLITVHKAPPDSECGYFSTNWNLISNGAIRSDNQSIDVLLPLILYPSEKEAAGGIGKEPNLSPPFLDVLAGAIGRRFDPGASSASHGGLFAEEMPILAPNQTTLGGMNQGFGPAQGTLSAPVPLPSGPHVFDALVPLGAELVALHLMESPHLDQHLTTFGGSGGPDGSRVEKVTYHDQTVWIDKAQSVGFRGVPEEVWNFHIGGYQVCEKWLKDRGPKKGKSGRILSPADINHYHRIVVSLSETIRIMREIDGAIEAHGGWPGAFQLPESAQ